MENTNKGWVYVFVNLQNTLVVIDKTQGTVEDALQELNIHLPDSQVFKIHCSHFFDDCHHIANGIQQIFRDYSVKEIQKGFFHADSTMLALLDNAFLVLDKKKLEQYTNELKEKNKQKHAKILSFLPLFSEKDRIEIEQRLQELRDF